MAAFARTTDALQKRANDRGLTDLGKHAVVAKLKWSAKDKYFTKQTVLTLATGAWPTLVENARKDARGKYLVGLLKIHVVGTFPIDCECGELRCLLTCCTFLRWFALTRAEIFVFLGDDLPDESEFFVCWSDVLPTARHHDTLNRAEGDWRIFGDQAPAHVVEATQTWLQMTRGSTTAMVLASGFLASTMSAEDILTAANAPVIQIQAKYRDKVVQTQVRVSLSLSLSLRVCVCVCLKQRCL